MNAHENFEETVGWLLHKNVEDGTPCLIAESYNKCRLIPGLTKSNIKDHQQIRMRLPGHYIRHDDEAAKKLVLWQPTKRRTNRGDVGTGELLPVCYYNELPRKIWEAAWSLHHRHRVRGLVARTLEVVESYPSLSMAAESGRLSMRIDGEVQVVEAKDRRKLGQLVKNSQIERNTVSSTRT